MTRFTTIATVALILGTASAASAQDWTNIDVSAMNNQWNAQQNAMMNDQMNQMIWANVNNPQVQALYVQQLNSGLFYGSIEEFAYKYIVTGGMTAAGYGQAMDTNADLNSQHQTMMNGYWDSMGNYRNSYDAYGNGYANNQGEAGTIMLGY